MIQNKDLQDDNSYDLDIGEEDNIVEHNLKGYVRDSHFIPSDDQGGDKYKQELISKLLQSGKESDKKKRPNIAEISNRLYKNNKDQAGDEIPPNDSEKISDFKKATAMV
jgi:hypothetical protein